MSVSRKEWSLEELKLLQTPTGRRKLLRSGRSFSSVMGMCHNNGIKTGDNKITGGKHYSFTAYASIVKASKVDFFVLKQIPRLNGRIKYALEQMLGVTLIDSDDFKSAIKGIKVVHFTYLLDIVNDSLAPSEPKLEYLFNARENLLTYSQYVDSEDKPAVEAAEPEFIPTSKSKTFTVNLFNLQLQADVDIENESTFSIKSLTIKLRELM
jgi:hypothetical protein